MALSIREKKLAVLWLADKAVMEHCMKEFGVFDIASVKLNREKVTAGVRKEFTEAEWAEIEDLDKQIPKD